MSVQYCYVCDNYIDTDTDAEHFEECVEKSTRAQQGYIWGLLNKELIWDRSDSDALVLKMYGVSQPEKLSKSDASSFIGFLKNELVKENA